MKKSDVKVFTPLKDVHKIKVAVITAKWHEDITNNLKEGANSKLLEHGIFQENIVNIDVPGAFELPQAAKMVLTHQNIHAIICLGCVIKGETHHDEFINHAVAQGLTHLSILSNKPVIFGVLTTLTYDQAVERSSGEKGNKGEECAVSAIHMLIVQQNLTGHDQKIGFT
ncbi:MAG: 6,7-dimethyl-8-ribityllumazine synthase [Saprospiraceae bacterium]|nr:6,7-dimethyl-8-ribityllumazine synthase [Saprospiraceae bacterium]MBK6566323.1 6,7-dimethyl-8-ribityllumazine synthase [Saprospiraceae bacterium]MBK7524247.1 6,7-dimethyl-8-ribityllumazine synthase [Saprospiraceae bacterium]MBK8081124.1 6,7-dimethyl-8-ribityllumazine synthase [Saprospiraceae bacterium]MBK8372832.1 6,7-dimethyl-8-ribityllumazine synthase [Saprospiraceae bacterium]